jgi:hypothetical protein
MNKELIDDIGDIIGVCGWGSPNETTGICMICEGIKERCTSLEVVSISNPDGKRKITVCRVCRSIVWPTNNRRN